MSILAHLVGGMGEFVVTRALAYLLNSHTGRLQAFIALLRPAGIQFDPGRHVGSEAGGDGGRPDMSIFDTYGNLRVLVENKFNAVLTRAQPAGYLGMLPVNMGSGLLFIVPRRRVVMVWDELQARCQDAGIDLGQTEGGRMIWTLAGAERRLLLITDWQNVLDVLEEAADGAKVRCDVAQFRGLIERLDAEDFQPLRSKDIPNADVPRRVLDYAELVDSICGILQQQGIAEWGTGGSYRAPFSMYRNLTLNRDNGDWAAVYYSPSLWRESGGRTPLWMWVNRGFHVPADFNDSVRDLWGDKCIPIDLQIGVDREQVIEDAVNQIAAMLQA